MNPEKQERMKQAQERHRLNTKDLTFKEWPKIGRLNRDIVITEKLDGTNAAVGIYKMAYTEIEAPFSAPDDVVLVDGSYYRVYAQSRSRIITPDDDNYGFARWVWSNREVLVRTLGEGIHFGEWWGLGIQRGYGLSERRFSLFNTAKWHNEVPAAQALAAARVNGVAIYSVPVLYTGPWTGMLGFIDGEKQEPSPSTPWLTPEQMQDWAEEQAVVNERERRVNSVLEALMLVPEVNVDEVRKVLSTLIDVNPRPRFAPNFIMEWLKRVGSFAVEGWMEPEGIVVYHRHGDVCFKATVEKDEQHKGAKNGA